MSRKTVSISDKHHQMLRIMSHGDFSPVDTDIYAPAATMGEIVEKLIEDHYRTSGAEDHFGRYSAESRYEDGRS